MSVYVNYLKQQHNDFNLVTALLEQALIDIKHNKIFHKFEKYGFLPPEYKTFLKAFSEYPNYYIKIENHHTLCLQFYKNALLVMPHRYELFYREIWDKLNKTKISVVCMMHEKKYIYFVIRNFKFEQNINTSYACTLEEAFETFVKYN